MNTNRGLFLAAVALLIAASLSTAGRAQAKQPQPQPAPDPAIVFEAGHPGGLVDLMVMNSDGSNKKILLRGGHHHMPSWSPDRSQVVFSSDTNGPGIYLINKDGTGLCKVVGTSGDQSIGPFVGPVWSPLPFGDGFHRIAYADTSAGSPDLFLVKAMCNAPAPTNLTQSDLKTEWFPTWSRSARRIAAAVQDYSVSPSTEGIVVYDLTDYGTLISQTNVTSIPGCPLAARWVAEPDWAKTQDKLVVEANLFSGEVADLWIIDLNNPCNAQNLTQSANSRDDEPSWSANDSEIVYRRQPFANGQYGYPVSLYKINVTTHALTELMRGGTGKPVINDMHFPDWRR